MKLSTKISAIVIISLATLGAALYLLLSQLLQERFEVLERQEISKNLDRVQNDIDNEREHLLTKTKDWAAWDDSYEFMKTHSKAYAQSNLTTESIIQLQIDGILYFDTKGDLFHTTYVDRANEVRVPLPQQVKSFFSDNKQILIHDVPESTRSGLTMIGGNGYIFTSLPIITSEYKGPINGSITFIKRIDDALLTSIGSRTRLQFSLIPISDSPKNVEEGDLVDVQGENLIAGSRYLKSYFNEPIFRAQILMTRDMMNEGNSLLESLMLILAIAGTILGLAFTFLIQKNVTARLLSLKTELYNIAQDRKHDGLVSANGDDELAELAHGINSTLTALHQAKDIAEEASKTKGEFVAHMSHELRTPLNGVCAATELLSDTNLSGDQKSLLNIVEFSAKNLLTIINDVLDLSKIQAGKLSISNAPCEIRSFVDTLIKSHEIAIVSKHIEILSFVDERVPQHILCDSLRLGQVLNNILGNAAKFTPPQGGIILNISVERLDASTAHLTFAVSDSGIGIEKNKQSIIFDPFAQADGTVTKKFGGTGLGLTISNRLVELMGGTLQVTSMPNFGTRFFFTIPVAIHTQAAPEETNNIQSNIDSAPMPNTSAKVLLVEDNKTNQYLMERILKKKNFLVTIVNNGEEAIQLLDHHTFDLILMDCQMPVMDGFTATTMIREQERNTSSHVPIIALTAYAMNDEQERCFACGMDYFISKPIEQKKLFDTINQALVK